MNTYRLTISYDGTRYRGWQKQKNTEQTIQWIIEHGLEEVLGYHVNISGSGRTDSGVHAFAQEASMRLPRRIDTNTVMSELNWILPEDIHILKLQEAKKHFHARKSAVGKCYEYYVDLREKPDVFTRKYCFHFPEKVDVTAMEEAAKKLRGKHDFRSFTDLRDSDDTIRTIFDISIRRVEDKLVLRFYGDGFLYHMVRILTGTLLNVGIGKCGPAQIPAILAARDRTWSGFPAPAKGLFLKQVYYEKEGGDKNEIDIMECKWNPCLCAERISGLF